MFSRPNHNSAQARLQAYANIVRQVLLQFNPNLDNDRLEVANGYGWSFRKGSANIEVYVSHDGDMGLLRVYAPLIHLPESGLLPLYRRLLEQNMMAIGVALGVHNDVVYVTATRELEGLDAVEANAMIQMVADYADHLDDDLITEFGGRYFKRV